MWSASNTFKEKAVDGFSPQNVVMVFNDLFFSANDGDFAEQGIVWNGYFNTAEDLTYGEAPSDTESFSLINDNGVLASFEYGVEQTYFGVQTDSESFSLPNGDNCYIEYDGDTYEGKADGLYVNGTKSLAMDVAVFGLLGYGGKVYAIGDGESVVIDTSLGTASSYSPNRFIVEKFRGGKSAVFDVSTYTATVWYLNSVDTWEYAPMGMYQVERPSQNLADIVKVTDAHDFMTLFDHDAAEFLASVSYPTTVAFLYESLCDWVGVDYETSVFPGSDTSFDASPFPDTSTTLRQVLKWIAEKAFSVAHFDREGILCLHWLGSSVAEEVGANNVSWKNLSIAEYAVAPVTNAILKDIAGNTITYESGDNPYVVAGNPFISTITAADLAEFRALPEYVPLTADVIYPDPCTDMGDIVSVQPNEDVRRMLTDAYSRALINEDEEAFAYEISPFVMPLMERTLTFNGWLSGRYVSRGNRKRLYDVDSTAYNASISISERVEKVLTPTEIFNKLTDNGRIQGLYMQDGQIFINAEYIKSGILEGIKVIAQQGSIGGWEIKGNALGKTIYDEENDVYYRVWLQPTITTNPTKTWILSCQKSTNGGQSFFGTFILYSDGSAKFGDLTISSTGAINVSNVGDAWISFGSQDLNYKSTVGAINQFFYDYRTSSNSFARIDATQYTIGDLDTMRPRAMLTKSGLYFYDASGVLTNSYPAT